MTRLTTNREPYFDDFDPAKSYHSVLFRPKRTIQTRELNQLQSILSNQIEVMGNHFFKFGSMVKSGSVRLKNHTPYIRLKDLDNDGDPINAAKLAGKQVKGVTSGLLAEVIYVTGKDEFDPATIFVNYKNTAIDGVTKEFLNGEELKVIDASGFTTYNVTVRCPDCVENPDSDTIEPTGLGCLFAAEESVYYVHGRFVPTETQMIVLDKYGTTPSMKVGFDIVQSIVTSQDDTTLNDNSLGEPNSTAPGADRYKIKLVLNDRPLDFEDSENFVMLGKIRVGELQEVNDKPQYGDIMDMMARRTYDESGDYTVEPFHISFKEHLSSGPGANDGWLPAEDGGDETKFATMVSPGKAYVRGREIELISELVVPVDKARDTQKKRSTVIRPTMGNYLTIKLDATSTLLPLDDTAGSEGANDFIKVSFYDGAASGGSVTGSQIGTARVKGMEMISGFVGGTGDDEPVYALYIFDLVLQAGKTILDVLSVEKSGNENFVANIEPDETDATTKIYEPIKNHLLFTLPHEHTKSIRDFDNPILANTTIIVIRKFTGAVNGSGNVVFAAEGNEVFLNYNSTRWIGGMQDVPGGNYLPFDLTTINAISTTPSEITIQAGVGNSGKNFTLIAEVLLTGVKEKTKTIDTKILNNIAGDVSSINLQVADAFRIVSVTDVTTGDPLTYVDVTDDYVLVPNIKDNYYDLSSVELKGGVAVPAGGTLLSIEVDYFEHSSDGEFFSVDSYTAIINDPNEDFGYEDIPTYKGSDGIEVRLSDAIDFRPTIGDDGTFSGTGAIIPDMPVDNSNVIFDVEFYLPRMDTLCVTELGEFRMVKGVPAEKPVAPQPAENSMPIYSLVLNPYTFSVEEDIKTSYIDNRRYTMRDIGRLEQRISSIEYYVTFSLLEKETSELNILDANGNSRFKNGFLVDNFKDYQSCQTDSSEFRCGLDTETGELRPSFSSRNVPVELNETNSTGYVERSDMLMLPYTEEVYEEQPFSSKTISVNPYFITEIEGTMALTPNMDVWRDVRTAPAMVVNINSGVNALRRIANSAGVLGTQWNNWQTTASRVRWSNAGRDLRSIETTSTQTRTGVARRIVVNTETRNLGTSLTDVNIIPFIRSIDVQFVATNLRPRTKLYAFFNDVDVTIDCRMLNNESGSDLVTDDNGGIAGSFRIPNRPDKRFFTGTRTFRLTNSPTDSRDPDELTTSAEAQFFAGGMSMTRRNTVVSIRRPRVIESQIRATRTVTQRRTIFFRRWGDDPLAQTFRIASEKGVYLTGIDLYFSQKSEDIPVWLQIRNTENGYPSSVVVPYSEVTLRPDQVAVSEDADVPTRFEFEAPVYLQPDEEYCFVVGASSEQYRVHTSKLGGVDKVTGSTIGSQPHLGSLFKSQNDSTWTAEQFEDIKFVMRRAKFDINQNLSVVFNNKDLVDRAALDNNPFETESGQNLVRVYHDNHGLVKNDKVNFELLSETWVNLNLSSGNLVIGQQITGSVNGGNAVIADLEYVGLNGSDKVYRVKLADLNGWFDDDEPYTGSVYYENFRNSRLLNAFGVVPRSLTHFVPVGTVSSGLNTSFNGIPLSDLSGVEHSVHHVDSMDSYTIQVSTAATSTGRTGGEGNFAQGHIQMDLMNFQANFIDYTGEAVWTYEGVKHGGVGSDTTNYAAVSATTFEPFENVELVEPMKIANKSNEDMFLGAGNKSFTVKGVLKSDDDFVSPVVNLDSIGFTAVTNRIEYNDCDNYSVAPNAGSWTVSCDEDGSTARWNGEEQSSGGSEGAKYIMVPVPLENPATNIKVFVDVLKFLHTDIEVWYRTLPSESESDIQSQEWVKNEFDKDVVAEHETDFREVEVSIPGTAGETLAEFKSFQIKLIMKSKNSARPPKAKNFRAIAVT